MKKLTNASMILRANDYRLLSLNQKSNQSISVRHLFRSPSITSLPLLGKQFCSLNIQFLNKNHHNNIKIVVASTTIYQRRFLSSVKSTTFNERIFRFSNCVNLRNSCKNSIFCLVSTAFPFSPVKKDFSSRASDHRTRSAVRQTVDLKKCKKSQRGLSFFCRFVHLNQGMMVWVSDYDKPDNSVNNITLLLFISSF